MLEVRTYGHPVVSCMMTGKDVLWASEMALRAACSEPKDERSQKGAARRGMVSLLCGLAFARNYGLVPEWQKAVVSAQRKAAHAFSFSTTTNFTIRGVKVRLVCTALKESGKYPNFGHRTSASVSLKEFERGRTEFYILAGWYAPYIDLIGWVTPDEIKPYQTMWGYRIEESMTHPMGEATWARSKEVS